MQAQCLAQALLVLLSSAGVPWNAAAWTECEKGWGIISCEGPCPWNDLVSGGLAMAQEVKD